MRIVGIFGMIACIPAWVVLTLIIAALFRHGYYIADPIALVLGGSLLASYFSAFAMLTALFFEMAKDG